MLALHRSGLLRSSFRSLCRHRKRRVQLRRLQSIPAAGPSPVRPAALWAASETKPIEPGCELTGVRYFGPETRAMPSGQRQILRTEPIEPKWTGMREGRKGNRDRFRGFWVSFRVAARIGRKNEAGSMMFSGCAADRIEVPHPDPRVASERADLTPLSA